VYGLFVAEPLTLFALQRLEEVRREGERAIELARASDLSR
jgi:hypothetical protein